MTDNDGRHDFDFWMGSWKVRNQRLRDRLKNSTEWIEFDATVVARSVLDGLGNTDEFRTDWDDGFIGMSLRLFNPDTRRWAIYWASTRPLGQLEPPVFGGFEGDTGLFLGPDTFDGRDIVVRFLWSGVTTPTPRWEQAFSDDDGATWETNWIMDFERADA